MPVLRSLLHQFDHGHAQCVGRLRRHNRAGISHQFAHAPNIRSHHRLSMAIASPTASASLPLRCQHKSIGGSSSEGKSQHDPSQARGDAQSPYDRHVMNPLSPPRQSMLRQPIVPRPGEPQARAQRLAASLDNLWPQQFAPPVRQKKLPFTPICSRCLRARRA